MAAPLIGGCLCGQVRYTVGGMTRFTGYACHCTDCQTRTGSAFALALGALAADLTVTGDVIEGHSTQPSGARATIIACATCLTRIYAANDQRPGFVALRAGTLDDSAAFVPGFHIWTASKQPWVVIPEGVPALSGQPEAQGWMALLRPRQE